MEEALELRRCFNLIRLKTGFKVDIFVSRGRAFDKERLERGLLLQLEGGDLRFSTAEDTVLAKLEWHALSPTTQQWRDVLGILLLQQGNLDRGYLTFWARELDVEALLARAILESEPGRPGSR